LTIWFHLSALTSVSLNITLLRAAMAILRESRRTLSGLLPPFLGFVFWSVSYHVTKSLS